MKVNALLSEFLDERCEFAERSAQPVYLCRDYYIVFIDVLPELVVLFMGE